MNSTAGRLLRIVLGIVLIWLGLSFRGVGGYIIAIIGLAPLSAGVFDVCWPSRLFGVPFHGKDIRAKCAAQGR